MATTDSTSMPQAAPARARSPLFSAVIGVTGLVVLLQAVWAGMFIREGQDFREKWVSVHSIGGTVAMALSLVVLIVAIAQLRSRRDLLIGSIAFFVLMVAEGLIGSLIGDSPAVETVHFPLALLLLAMTAWLSLRASRPA